MTQIRPSLLKGMPTSMYNRPVSKLGFPVPWFVQRGEDGEWDFHQLQHSRFQEALVTDVCWVTGEPLELRRALVTGPISGMQLFSPEPASTPEAAHWAVRVCPYMLNSVSRSARTLDPDKPIDSVDNSSAALSVVIEYNKTYSEYVQYGIEGKIATAINQVTNFVVYHEGVPLSYDDAVAQMEKSIERLSREEPEHIEALRKCWEQTRPIISAAYNVTNIT